MTDAWLTEDHFVWALGFFLRTIAANYLEPIPAPTPRAIQHAASRIVAINEPVFGRKLHRALTKKTAVATYELCKQHFFVNGNKRIAYFFLRYLLLINGLRLRAGLVRRADLMKWIAESDPHDRDNVIRSVVRFLRREIEPIPEATLVALGFRI